MYDSQGFIFNPILFSNIGHVMFADFKWCFGYCSRLIVQLLDVC